MIIEIYPTVIELSKDPIANVRINSAKALKSLYLIMGEKEKVFIYLLIIKLNYELKGAN